MNANQSDECAGGVLLAWEKDDECTPSCPNSKATDETNELDRDQRQKDQTRHTRRLKNLRAHHDRCEARYKAACVKRANEEKERTSFLHQIGLMQSQQSSSESDDTIILGPMPAAVIQDMSVPELTRTNSVNLHKPMLGYTEEAPSSSEISDSLKDSDSSVDVKQLKRKKKRAQKTTSASSLEVQQLKRRRVTTSSSLAANIDPQEKMSVDSGSDTEEEVDSTEWDAATSSSRSPGQFEVTWRCTTEVGKNKDLPSAKERSDDKVPVAMEVSGKSNTTKGPLQMKRVKWSQKEIQAVEKTLKDCIDSGKVPRKAQCMKCIEASPVALKNRTWQAVKFYVKNCNRRIKKRDF